MAQSKEEIIRYVNEWVAQMKQKKHANTRPGLCRNYGGRGPHGPSAGAPRSPDAPPARSAGEGNPPPLFKNAPPLAQHLVF